MTKLKCDLHCNVNEEIDYLHSVIKYNYIESLTEKLECQNSVRLGKNGICSSYYKRTHNEKEYLLNIHVRLLSIMVIITGP